MTFPEKERISSQQTQKGRKKEGRKKELDFFGKQSEHQGNKEGKRKAQKELDFSGKRANIKQAKHRKEEEKMITTMKKTQRYERRLAEARNGDEINVLQTYEREINREQMRMDASRNDFVKVCCQQNIDQLRAEKNAIDEEWMC